jgi:uncharacterized damage-inducible protein DinB
VNTSTQNIQFDYCANMASIEALRQASSPLSEALKIAAHIAGIGELWLARVDRREPSLTAWPSISLSELSPMFGFQRDRWVSLASKYSDFSQIHYVTRTGVNVANTFAEIVQEVLLHSAHHRGQIALLLRQSSSEPPTSTDYIPTIRKLSISDNRR